MGALFVIFVFIVLYCMDSRDNIKSWGMYRKVLCIPTGEIVKIRFNKFNMLLNLGIIKWSNKYKMYIKYFNHGR